ncbi:pheromone receptor transcription factor [Trichomonascus vanleenenianus]|uniref:pheromone receptor transcription factor n=1 Tax=Trichomonascus vanleenenianus TaxID=2268995 RepID=UPI003ECB827F
MSDNLVDSVDMPQGQPQPPPPQQNPNIKPEEDEEDDDERKTGRERRKIEIKFIADKSRRHITFSKRKAGIMKKAYELSVLTGTQVLLLVVSETGLVYTFTTPKLQPLVTKPEGKNLIQACLNAPEENGDQPTAAPPQQPQAAPPPPPPQTHHQPPPHAPQQPMHEMPPGPPHPMDDHVQQAPPPQQPQPQMGNVYMSPEQAAAYNQFLMPNRGYREPER